MASISRIDHGNEAMMARFVFSCRWRAIFQETSSKMDVNHCQWY